MAYDKPLKMQWTEINGRAVPLVLPQYWSEEQDDWVVSSEQNRLPVDAQLTGRKVELQRMFTESSTAIPAGNSENTEMYMGANNIGNVLGVRIVIPAIPNSTGSHFVEIWLGRQVQWERGILIARAETESTSSMTWVGSVFNETLNSKEPATNNEFRVALNTLKLDDVVPVTFRYSNISDTEQSTPRNFTIIVEKEAKAL